MKKQLKLLTYVLMIVFLIMGTLTGFSVHKGFGTIYYEDNYKIFNQVTFGELIGENSIHGIENACFVQADISKGNLKPFVFAGEVRGSYTLEDMVKYAEESGYKVVAGINGDIYDTSTGVPKGTVIHGGNIVTSGYQPNRVITFDKDNAISMATVGLRYSLTTNIASEVFKTNIDYFNVNDGGSGSLFIYNRHYSPSTKTSGERVEVVIDVEDMQMAVNKIITGTVNSVVNSSNTTIGEKQFVLSTSKDCPYAAWLSKMQPGEAIELSCTETGSGLADAKEAMGLYHNIVENGKMVTVGTAVNPRTALGVKSDGSVILYAIDGRQNDKSLGISMVELANHMIDLGCVSAWNLDGGGSTQMVVRKPGIDTKATLKNSPSGGTARKVSNGLLLVYKGNGGSDVANIHIYPSSTVMLAEQSVTLKAYATNDYYEKVPTPKDITYAVNSYGAMNDSIFTAGKDAGVATIVGTYGNLVADSSVQIVDQVIIKPSTKKLMLTPGETKQVSASIFYGIYQLPKPKLPLPILVMKA